METSGKGFGNMTFIILHHYSEDYSMEDSPNSFSSLVLQARDSVPDGSKDGSSSCLVLSPWLFRHGAMDPSEGTPFVGDFTPA